MSPMVLSALIASRPRRCRRRTSLRSPRRRTRHSGRRPQRTPPHRPRTRSQAADDPSVPALVPHDSCDTDRLDALHTPRSRILTCPSRTTRNCPCRLSPAAIIDGMRPAPRSSARTSHGNPGPRLGDEFTGRWRALVDEEFHPRRQRANGPGLGGPDSGVQLLEQPDSSEPFLDGRLTIHVEDPDMDAGSVGTAARG